MLNCNILTVPSKELIAVHDIIRLVPFQAIDCLKGWKTYFLKCIYAIQMQG